MIGFLLCVVSTAAAVPYPGLTAESRAGAVALDQAANDGYIGSHIIGARRVPQDSTVEREAEATIQADGGTQVVEGVHELGGTIGAGVGASLGTGLGVVRGVGSSIRNIVGGGISTAIELTHSIGTGFRHGLYGGSNVTVEAGQLGVKDVKAAIRADATVKTGSRGRGIDETYESDSLTENGNDDYELVDSNINSRSLYKADPESETLGSVGNDGYGIAESGAIGKAASHAVADSQAVLEAIAVPGMEPVGRHESEIVSSKASSHSAVHPATDAGETMSFGHGIPNSEASSQVVSRATINTEMETRTHADLIPEVVV